MEAAASRGREASLETCTLPAKATVVYFLSGNGQLHHPHSMEVPLSSPHAGLYLRDVIGRLRVLRGPALAAFFSWSSKRSYRNGYVWHDLSINDLIHPVKGNQYVLKGTPLFRLASSSSSSSSTSSSYSSSSKKPLQDDTFAPSVRRNHTAPKADASTQTTEDHRRHGRRTPVDQRIEKKADNPAAELSRDDLPPPLPSSSEMLESLIKVDGRGTAESTQRDEGQAVGRCLSERLKASTVLMHLISCGSIAVKEASGLSPKPQHRGGLDRAKSMGRVQSCQGARWLKEEEEECFNGRSEER